MPFWWPLFDGSIKTTGWLLHLPQKLEFGAEHGIAFKLTTFQSQVGKEGWKNPLLPLAFFFFCQHQHITAHYMIVTRWKQCNNRYTARCWTILMVKLKNGSGLSTCDLKFQSLGVFLMTQTTSSLKKSFNGTYASVQHRWLWSSTT